ncbi:hypothetical protein H4R33_001205 [Dimargaris cristalligena]|uniref:BCAS3 WD40 domain-containing protein n=1 Tax=Dimargaris cristalligena TaxID=215637 RepID=A0A4V1J5A3_9FUNG|nr:hypothetical protein H4R33_001205 [Dimargaris cristalligena]RKP38359.1 hypothetical protein BJ085DRAFT_36204 [Dimargaris cristalligena]|eukprot:RKP38359.1 hypothetical protein BJ085DRAFT_36204 [Dimargaris cristalligena]
MSQGQSGSSSGGRRAKPVFLKEPSSLESLTWVWSDLTSRVAQSLPASIARPGRWSGSSPQAVPPPGPRVPAGPLYAASMQPTSPMPYHPASAYGPPRPPSLAYGPPGEVPPEWDAAPVLYSAFEAWPRDPLALNSSLAACLCLGYPDGFQVWDISDIDNIREIISVRDVVERVTAMRYLRPSPKCQAKLDDVQLASLPWVACVHSAAPSGDSEPPSPNPTRYSRPIAVGNCVSIFSLSQQTLLHSFSFAPHTIIEMTHNDLLIAVTLDNGTLHLIDITRQEVVAQFDHVSPVPDEVSTSPRIALGPRFLAFPTCQIAPVKVKLTPIDDPAWTPQSRHAVEKVAKDVVNGVKVLGSFGYKTLSNYFSPAPSTTQSPSLTYPPPLAGSGRSGGPVKPPPVSDPDEHLGNVIVYDLQEVLDALPTDSASTPLVTAAPVAHFVAHRHPIHCLVFSPGQTLLATVSTQGHALNVFSLLGRHDRGFATGGPGHHPAVFDAVRGIRHLYRLARGITDALVESISFSPDAHWVAASTSRGTTHVFPINPQGGPVDAPAHLGPAASLSPLDAGYSLSNGSSVWKSGLTSVPAVVRIKQRAPLAPASPLPRPPSHPHYPEDLGVFPMELPSTDPYSIGYPAMGHRPPQSPPAIRGSLVTYFGPSSAGAEWYATLHGQYYPSTSFGTGNPTSTVTPRHRVKQLIQPLLLWIFHPNATLTLHRLTPSCVAQKGKHAAAFHPRYTLAVNRDDLAEWDVIRHSTWATLPWKAPRQAPAKNPAPGPSTTAPQSAAIDWMVHMELVTCPLINPEPLWAQSQFQFQCIIPPTPTTPTARFSGSPAPAPATEPWFPKVRVWEFKRGAPRPYGTASMDRGDGDNSPYSYQVQDRLHNAMNSVLDIRYPLAVEPLLSPEIATVSPASDDFLAVNKPRPIPFLYSEQVPSRPTLPGENGRPESLLAHVSENESMDELASDLDEVHVYSPAPESPPTSRRKSYSAGERGGGYRGEPVGPGATNGSRAPDSLFPELSEDDSLHALINFEADDQKSSAE